jgi:hypothetical protein
MICEREWRHTDCRTRRGVGGKRQDIRGDGGVEGDEGKSDGEVRRRAKIPRLENSGDTGNGHAAPRVW